MTELLEETNKLLSTDERTKKKKDELRRVFDGLRNVPVNGKIPNVYAEAALTYSMVQGNTRMELAAAFYFTGKIMTTIKDEDVGWFSHDHPEYSKEFVKEFAELLGDNVDIDNLCLVINSIDSYININRLTSVQSHTLMMDLTPDNLLETVHTISECIEELESTFEVLDRHQRKDIYSAFRDFIRQYTK